VNKIISRYVSEHEHGMVHLTFLRDAIARVIQKGSNAEDLRVIEDSVSFLSDDLIEHCAKEESELYPLLKDRIAPGIIWKLSEEHNLINIKLIEFQKTVEVLKDCKCDGVQIVKLKEDTDSFIDLLYTHIKEENNLLNSLLRSIKDERKHNEKKTIRI